MNSAFVGLAARGESRAQAGWQGVVGDRHVRCVVLKFCLWQWDNERANSKQGDVVAVSDLPQSGSHPFYEKLNRLLTEYGFDHFVETQCREEHQGQAWIR